MQLPQRASGWAVQRGMELRVASPEVLPEPVIQRFTKRGRIVALNDLVLLHDLADPLEQLFVLVLMRQVARIMPGAHDLLFEREVGRYLRVEFAQEVGY